VASKVALNMLCREYFTCASREFFGPTRTDLGVKLLRVFEPTGLAPYRIVWVLAVDNVCRFGHHLGRRASDS
jgi:hypothetical protein